MKHTKHLLSSLFAFALVLGGWASAQAQTEVVIRAPAPMKESFDKLLPMFETKTGYKVTASYGTGVGTKQEAAKGDPYDVFVILPPYQEALNSGNLVKKDGKTVGAFILAVTVKRGSPLPDISTAAAVKKDLLNAKALTTVDPTMGSVGVATNACLMKLGILEQVQSKLKYFPNGGGVSKSVVDGTADIGLGPYVSDLKGNKNPDLIVVGGLPKEASTPTDIFIVPATKAKDAKAAKELVQFLDSADAKAVYADAGIQTHK
jgi:molybdate transport system substrate-binding protein